MTVIFSERAELHGPYFNADGKIVPSVTGIIGSNLGWDSDKLYRWIARMTNDGYDYQALTSVAAEIGTCCHQLVERRLNTDLDPVDPSEWAPKVWDYAMVGYQSFVEWEEQWQPSSLFSELKLVHPELSYGGTLDYGTEFMGGPALIDFKTSDAVRRGHIIQVSAYRELWRTNVGSDPKVYVLRLNVKGGPAHLTEVTGSMDLGFKVFQQCLALNALKREWEYGMDDRLGKLL